MRRSCSFRSVVRQAERLRREEIAHLFDALPRGELPVHEVVLLRDRVGPDDDRDMIVGLDVALEVLLVRTGRIADDKPRREVDRLGAVSDHLLRHVLNVSTGAAVARRIADEFQRLVGAVAREPTDALPHRPQALPASTRPVAIADDDPDLHVIASFAGLLRIDHKADVMARVLIPPVKGPSFGQY
jgi:hypothetical protein